MMSDIVAPRDCYLKSEALWWNSSPATEDDTRVVKKGRKCPYREDYRSKGWQDSL